MMSPLLKADEGMWLLKELNRQSVERMKELEQVVFECSIEGVGK